jgi:DNA-binding NarL/FixJ family response regulator
MEFPQDRSHFSPHLKILIADDHALVPRGLRECLRDFLAEDGLTPHIVGTSSAHDAIAQIHAATWNLVILDLNLPDMPGLEILRILKSVQPTAAALVLSIYAEEHYAARAVRAGALGYLTKDRGPEELRSAVSRLLQGEPYRHADAAAPHQYRGPHRNALLGDSHPPVLSDREFEVLQWIAQGRRLTDIAEHLKLSIKTVSTYRTRLLIKLGLKTTAELVRYALDQQVV